MKFKDDEQYEISEPIVKPDEKVVEVHIRRPRAHDDDGYRECPRCGADVPPGGPCLACGEEEATVFKRGGRRKR